MTTIKYRPDSCDPAKLHNANNCSDIVTFWDCLFGKRQWKDLYKKKCDVWEENGHNYTDKTTQKELRKPVKLASASAKKPTKSTNQAKKPKTVFRREIYSLEIEPTNLLRYLWPWKIKDNNLKNADNKGIEQQKRTNGNELGQNKKPLVKRRIRKEQKLMVEENIDNVEVNGIVTQTASVRRQQGESTRKLSLTRTNENDHIFPPPNSRRQMKKLPPATFITAQLTDLSMKIDKLENRIISLSSNERSHQSGHERDDKNVTIPSMKKSGSNTSKQNRNVTKVRRSGITRVSNVRSNKKVYRRFLKPDENPLHTIEENNTQNFRNVSKQPQRYTIRRSESNPSLLKIHASKYSKCYNNNIDACILIHTQKKDVCVHGSYLDIKQNQSWWNQIRNIISSVIDKVFYRNTERKIEDNNHNGTMMAKNRKNYKNNENGSSSDDESFHSFDTYDLDLGEESKSCSFLINRKSVSYTILNKPKEMADYDYRKELENVVENVLNTRINLLLDSETIFRGNTSKIIDSNYEDPIDERSSCIQDTIIGRETFGKSVENHTSDSFNNRHMLGELYSTNKYRFSHGSNQGNHCGNHYQQPKINYSSNKNRKSNENDYFEMKLCNNSENSVKKGDVLCPSVKVNEEIYGVETGKNKIETPEERVGLVTFTKILHSKFKSTDSKTEYKEKLTKTVRSEFIDPTRDLSILKQFTRDESFFPFSEKGLHTKEENREFFPNLEDRYSHLSSL